MARVNQGSAAVGGRSYPSPGKYRVKEGDQLTLITPRGPATFEIAGIYSDYTRDQGVVLMAQKAFEEFWETPIFNRSRSISTRRRRGAPGRGVSAQFSREG